MIYQRDVLERMNNSTSPELPGWKLGPDMGTTIVEPGDLILTDARYAHWPYSLDSASSGGVRPGRFGLTFMANTYLGDGFKENDGSEPE